MATTSACAVGSFVEVTRFAPSAMMWPSLTMTQPNGPPPARLLSISSAMARRMNWSDMAECLNQSAFGDGKAQCGRGGVGPRSKFETASLRYSCHFKYCAAKNLWGHRQKCLCYLQEMRLAVGCSHVLLPAAGESSGSRPLGGAFRLREPN